MTPVPTKRVTCSRCTMTFRRGRPVGAHARERVYCPVCRRPFTHASISARRRKDAGKIIVWIESGDLARWEGEG